MGWNIIPNHKKHWTKTILLFKTVKMLDEYETNAVLYESRLLYNITLFFFIFEFLFLKKRQKESGKSQDKSICNHNNETI